MISKRDDAMAAGDEPMGPTGPAGATGAVAAEPLPKPLDQIEPPPVEDTATRLARLAREENTWEGARAALLRAMQLTREWEREQPHPHGENLQ